MNRVIIEGCRKRGLPTIAARGGVYIAGEGYLTLPQAMARAGISAGRLYRRQRFAHKADRSEE